MTTLESSMKRNVSMLNPLFPIIPHGVDIFNTIFPRVVFPRALSAAENLAEGRTAHFPFLVRRNDRVRFFPNRELNDDLRPARWHFAGHVNSQPMAGRNVYGLRYGHTFTIPQKGAKGNEE